jgi:hypothetical protein
VASGLVTGTTRTIRLRKLRARSGRAGGWRRGGATGRLQRVALERCREPRLDDDHECQVQGAQTDAADALPNSSGLLQSLNTINELARV